MNYINYPSITQFQQHVELKDFRAPTKKEYVRYVRKLAEHFQCDPATLTEDKLRQYFLFLRQHKHYKAATMNGAKVNPEFGSLMLLFSCLHPQPRLVGVLSFIAPDVVVQFNVGGFGGAQLNPRSYPFNRQRRFSP